MINVPLTKSDKMTQDLNNNNIIPPTAKPVVATSNGKSPRKQHRQNNDAVNGDNQHGSSNGNHSNNNNTQTMKVGKDAVAGLPNEKILLDLMESTGYQLTHHNGQRKFGPPPNFKGMCFFLIIFCFVCFFTPICVLSIINLKPVSPDFNIMVLFYFT